MLIKPLLEPVLMEDESGAHAIQLYQESDLPFVAIINEQQQYKGVFDKHSMIKMFRNQLIHQESVKEVMNKNFPTVYVNELPELFSLNSDSYTLVLEENRRIAGFITPFESKDFFSLLNIPFFDRLMESISDGILICDSELVVHKVNQAYTRLTGVFADEIEGRVVTEIRKGATIPKAVHSGQIMKNIYRKEGDREYFVDLYPIKVNDEVVGGMVLAKDITEIQNLTHKVAEWESKFSKLKSRINQHHRASITFEDIVVRNARMMESVEMAKKIASNDSAIMIRGESGTGKEVFAQAIHNYSYRKENPFVAVNCAAIEPTLIHSELFGYEDGAFTGAAKGGKMGLFEVAHKGTVFLDEIGDMDFELQSKLLRVLETGEINRVGGNKNIKVDVRIISATNVDLEKNVEEKKFRADLYFRLNVIPIDLLPLRKRKEDIPPLVEVMLENLRQKIRKPLNLEPEVMEAFTQYNWPGNIRELQNVLTFAANMQNEGTITMEHIPQKMVVRKESKSLTQEFSPKTSEPKEPPMHPEPYPMNLSETEELRSAMHRSERDKVIQSLKTYGSNVEGKKKAAEALGISVATLYNRINQYGLKGIRF